MPEVPKDGRAPGCPDDDTLASYLDGAHAAERRAEITAHLATCEHCYELVSEVLRAQPVVTAVN